MDWTRTKNGHVGYDLEYGSAKGKVRFVPGAARCCCWRGEAEFDSEHGHRTTWVVTSSPKGAMRHLEEWFLHRGVFDSSLNIGLRFDHGLCRYVHCPDGVTAL